jgi:hypothetical protein
MSQQTDEAIYGAKFWQSYENHLSNHSINPKHYRWYKNWCQQFIKFMGATPLLECEPKHVSAFLNNLRDTSSIKDWQLEQARSALWCLFHEQLKISWAVKGRSRSSQTVINPKRPAPPPLSESHRATLKKLRSTLLGRQYAKRTVESYLDWATRFLAYFSKSQISDLEVALLDSQFQARVADHISAMYAAMERLPEQEENDDDENEENDEDDDEDIDEDEEDDKKKPSRRKS